jgi:hypothetical protein
MSQENRFMCIVYYNHNDDIFDIFFEKMLPHLEFLLFVLSRLVVVMLAAQLLITLAKFGVDFVVSVYEGESRI